MRGPYSPTNKQPGVFASAVVDSKVLVFQIDSVTEIPALCFSCLLRTHLLDSKFIVLLLIRHLHDHACVLIMS